MKADNDDGILQSIEYLAGEAERAGFVRTAWALQNAAAAFLKEKDFKRHRMAG